MKYLIGNGVKRFLFRYFPFKLFGYDNIIMKLCELIINLCLHNPEISEIGLISDELMPSYSSIIWVY